MLIMLMNIVMAMGVRMIMGMVMAMGVRMIMGMVMGMGVVMGVGNERYVIFLSWTGNLHIV
jgi:hypothetical protein